MKVSIKVVAVSLGLALSILSTSASAAVCHCACVSNDGLVKDSSNPGVPSYGETNSFPSVEQCSDQAQFPNGVTCVIRRDGSEIPGMGACNVGRK